MSVLSQTLQTVSAGLLSREPQQEVVCLSYLALPIRRGDLLFNMCSNKGQENWLQQEAAVREKAGGADICFSRFIVTVERSWVRH